MTEEKPTSVSWSRLRSWIECKQKAHLQSQGIKSPSQNIKVFHKGTTVDRILRDWLLDPFKQQNTMPSMVEDYIDLCAEEAIQSGSGVVRWEHNEEKKQAIAWCKRLLVKAEPLMEELVLPYQYKPDVRFRTPIMIPDLEGNPRQIDLIGAMDIEVIEAPMLYSVYDLKATENELYWKKTIMQLVFYALAEYSMNGVYPEKIALIQPLCEQQVLRLKYNQEHVLSLVDKITQYAHSVWGEDYSPKENDTGCSWCPVRFACSKFSKGKDSKRVSFK